MKLSKIAMLAAIACASYASNATAGENNMINLVSHCAAACDCGEPACGCESTGCCDTPVADCCNNGCCDSGCCDSGCDSMGCGLGGGLLDGLTGDCCHDDPWSLFGDLGKYSVGGWVQMGYHDKANGIFNTRADEFQLHQAWLYAERAIDTSCGFDIGGRIDYVYGTDGPNTQAFGTDPRGWDNDWDNGGDYGHALPQAYFEAGYGDLSVKVGHFYTIIGYEVVTAPDNFFYSHAYTFNFSEPFTHTGALATYNASDDLTLWGGYTFGWDSGFDDNGDAFLGGISAALSDDLTLTYATTFGRFNDFYYGGGNGFEQGYMHSIVADMTLSENLNYIVQSDYLDTENSITGATQRETIGLNQYLLYTINDCWGLGGRLEYYDIDNNGAGQASDVWALTGGINYRPNANLIIRPEVRYDDDDNAITGLQDGFSQTTFGFDTIFLF